MELYYAIIWLNYVKDIYIYIVDLFVGDILRQIYCGNCITADILRHIYYGRYIMADTLWTTCCVPQQMPYLKKCTAPEALDCCIQICLLQRITPASPETSQTAVMAPTGCAQGTGHFIMYTGKQGIIWEGTFPCPERCLLIRPRLGHDDYIYEILSLLAGCFFKRSQRRFLRTGPRRFVHEH